jgi:hypothetical protein
VNLLLEAGETPAVPVSAVPISAVPQCAIRYGDLSTGEDQQNPKNTEKNRLTLRRFLSYYFDNTGKEVILNI